MSKSDRRKEAEREARRARRLAERVVKMAPLVVHEPPVELEGFAFAAVWHERRQREPAHRFLRELVAAAAAAHR